MRGWCFGFVVVAAPFFPFGQSLTLFVTANGVSKLGSTFRLCGVVRTLSCNCKFQTCDYDKCIFTACVLCLGGIEGRGSKLASMQ